MHHWPVHWPFAERQIRGPHAFGQELIWWENNAPMSPGAFDHLHADMLAHMTGRDYFVQNVFGGADPEIYATTHKLAPVVENMVNDPETLEPDFADKSLPENTRRAYPLDYISNASATGLGGMLKSVIMLTCDAYGVLPPIARLTPAQAMYHFLSGFTSKTPGTERGVVEPTPTFSTCFGAPFMPRRPEVYGKLLQEKIAKTRAAGWSTPAGRAGRLAPEGACRSGPPAHSCRRLWMVR